MAAQPDEAATASARAGRVAEMHRQTRPGLAISAGFALAAGIAAFVPHRTGAWLPLHLFLAGAMLSAISSVTLMLSVTWSTAAPPKRVAVRVQRTLLATGVAGLAVSREVQAPPAAFACSGLAVVASLVILGILLIGVHRNAVLDRFDPAIEGYVAAVALALVGAGLGTAAGSGHDAGQVVSIHLTMNLFGLVGVVIAATLPYMTATQIRSKMSPRATPMAIRGALAGLVGATVLSALGLAMQRPPVASFGLGVYAAGVVGVVTLCPVPRWRNVRWAGPRLGCLVLGVIWWIGASVGFAISVGSTTRPSTGLSLALVIGGYGQILAGSLAYLVPVLRGGGHVRLAEGFRLTRCWPTFVAVNIAAAGALLGSPTLTLTGIAAIAADTTIRAVLLARPTAPAA